MSDSEPPHSAAVVIAGTFTLEPLLPLLGFVLCEAGLTLDVECAPYNQVFQELLSATSVLARNAGGVNVIAVRMEDFARDLTDLETSRSVISRSGRELSAALDQFAQRAKSPTLLAVLPRCTGAAIALQSELDAAAVAIVEHARTVPGLHLVTPAELDDVSTGEKYDRLRDEIAHIPFTEDFYGSMALVIGRKVHALRVPVHKVLVLDCDNTLWGGVVGEDGVEGIAISDAYLRVQHFAVEQHGKGILVCLASKNAERDVLDVFERRSDMTLRAEQVVSHRINWKPKADNLSSLARELNLGLDSFVLLDDNPIECAQIRAALPHVVTLQLPPAGHVERFLANLWVFDKLAVTSEDSRRTSLYRENAARQLHEESATDIAEFVASLDLKIDISAPLDSELPRVAQLTQRTNQFNFTTVRRTEMDIRTAQFGGALVLRVNVRDRFGDYGLVGVIIANVSQGVLVIDTLLLSCRVLGRGVEHVMIRRLGELAAERDLAYVELPYVLSAKNEPAGAFAESIAGDFKIEDERRILFRMPVALACGIAHRPGNDPEAVINARKAEEGRATSTTSGEISSSMSNRSERYSKLALDLVSGHAVVDALRIREARMRSLPGPLEKAATATEQRLLTLWQELLNVDELGVEDEYFALGGTSLLAAQMFGEIAKRFGVKLRLTTILESPTVRALARYIEPTGVERSGNLVELKRGGRDYLFLVHDGDGETLLYLNLARRMPDGVAVFGIEPRRISKIPLAHTRIEDMAHFYIEELRKKQPTGPYMLGGLCAGGVIAYEMGSQLRRSGERVSLVAIFDAAKPRALTRPGRLSSQRVQRLKQMLADAGQKRKAPLMRTYAVVKAASRKLLGFLSWQISSRTARWSTRIRFRVLREVLERRLSWPSFLTELSVREIYDSAEAQYVPQTMSDESVLLMRAQFGEGGDTPYREIFADDTFGWKSIAPKISVVDVEGGHSSMLQEPFVESLALALTRKVTCNSEEFAVNYSSRHVDRERDHRQVVEG